MLKHLNLTGAAVSEKDVLCVPCDYTRAGGFHPDAGAVIMCQGRFFSKKHMEDTLVHELVHMYDHAKFKVDWSNLRHHACSEVRTAIRILARRFRTSLTENGVDSREQSWG